MLWIDSAQAEHSEAVWRMLRRFVTSYEPSREAFDRDYPRLVTAEESDFSVAWECETQGGGEVVIDGKSQTVVGYLLAHRMPTLFAGGPILQIVELYVEEARRGQGIGGVLVNTALEKAWAMGCVEAVVPTRRASGFYRRLGFEPTAEFLNLRHPL